ncbi:MAG TPA: HypC/HybG/HupF family hydrogenase formation chaperone [Patescibacteria group bacterium]
MCLTIPKKVLEIKENYVVVEDHNGDRQELKTLIELAIGDFVLSQQNVVVEKIEPEYAEEIFEMIRK